MPKKTFKLDETTEKLMMFFPLFYRRAMMVWHKAQGTKMPNQYYMALGMIIKNNPMQMSDIGNLLCISKPNTTFVINKLIAEGKLERLPDKKDRRIINISATEKGKLFMKEHKKKVRENLKKTLSNLSDDELDTLYDSIDKLNNVMSKIGWE